MASFTFLTLKKSFSNLNPAIQPQKCIKYHKIAPPPKKKWPKYVWKLYFYACLGDLTINLYMYGRPRD